MTSLPSALTGTTLIPGRNSGLVLTLDEPLNAWGGLDPATGLIIHHSHPQRGESIAGKVLVMAQSRGSGTNAQVFAQAWANGNGPAAIVLEAPDFVVCAGAAAVVEMYKLVCPIVTATAESYGALTTGQVVEVDAAWPSATIRVLETSAAPASRTHDEARS